MDPGLPSEPSVLTTPKSYDAPELTAAVNSENEESQLGAATAATTSPSGFDLSRIPMGPEEEEAPLGMDPVSTDASAMSSTLNRSNVTGIPSDPLMARNTTADPESLGRTIGPRVRAINQTSLNPAMIGAGLGGGSAIDMSKADLDEADDYGLSSNKVVKGLDLGAGGAGGGAGDRGEKSLSTPTETMADGVDGEKVNAGDTGYSGGEKSSASPTDAMSDGFDGDKASSADDSGENTIASPMDIMADGNKAGGNEAQGENDVQPKSNVSKEALRGPSAPPARDQFEFEKNMEVRRSIGHLPSGVFFVLYVCLDLINTNVYIETRDKAKNAAQGNNQKISALSKVKDKIGSHMHHTTKT